MKDYGHLAAKQMDSTSPEVTLFFVVILVGLSSKGIGDRRRGIQSFPAIQALSLAPGDPALRGAE
jgi:hypothetical protein